MRKLRLLITGGGSGGHIYPLVAITDALREIVNTGEVKRELEIRYFGSPRVYKELLIHSDVHITPIRSSKLRRYFDVRNFLDFFNFFIGLSQAMWKVYWYMPGVAVSKGGSGALAVLLACKFYQIPIIIHESDAVPGLANKVSAKSARLILLAFQGAQQYFPKRLEFHVVGNPIRTKQLQTVNSREVSKEVFKLDRTLPVLLFLGGSLGAKALNAFVFKNTAILCQKYQILHQVGKNNFDSYDREYRFYSEKYEPQIKRRYVYVPFFEHDYNDALNAADVVVSRAGSGTIFESALAGKPSILIPLPGSANNHQWENAIAYEDAGAAVVVTQENLLIRLFSIQLDKVFDPTQYMRMSEAAKNFAKPDAATVVARDIVLVATGKLKKKTKIVKKISEKKKKGKI